MRPLFEEILASLRSAGRSPEPLARVVGLILLGIVLNLAALQMVESLHSHTHSHARLSPISDVARHDIGAMRVAVARVLKKMNTINWV
jgi:hypothetical protein